MFDSSSSGHTQQHPQSVRLMAPAAFSEALKLYGERQYVQALESCRSEAQRTRTQPRDPLLLRLLDEICMHSAATGQVIGFDGRLLQVLPANPDTAWLGVQQHQRPSVCDPDAQVLEFSSINDALQHAQDGDVVQLLPGTHVTSQDILKVTKRIMVTAVKGCANSQVILDHRANAPAFWIERSCILRGFTIDMVGFTAAIHINGSSTTVKPILQDVLLCCSGDDGIDVHGKAQPLIRSCEIRARFCGLKQNDHASTTLWQSTIAGGKHALIAVGESQTFFEGCRLQDCSGDGVMGTQKVRVNLTDTTIINCRGPAIDMSDESSVVMKQVDVVNCEGGVFLWHKASCEAICSHITGGSTYAVLLDAEAYARGSSCTIDGPCHITNMPGEKEDHSDGASDDSLRSSGSPVYRRTMSRGSAAAAAASDAKDAANGAATGRRLSRQAFKAAVAARAAAVAGMTGVRPGAAATADLQSFGPTSPFGSSNGSAAGSAYEFELGLDEDLVQASMLVADKAVAAALFPQEQGAFAPPQRNFYNRY